MQRPLVLVLEHEHRDWEVYGNVLLYNGFDVLHAADGREGLRIAQEQLPDLVLVDLGLPGLNGLDVCRALRSDPLTAIIPIILMARSRAEYEHRARKAGCSRLMEKPVNPVAVLHEVERLIGRPPLPGVGRPPRVVPDF